MEVHVKTLVTALAPIALAACAATQPAVTRAPAPAAAEQGPERAAAGAVETRAGTPPAAPRAFAPVGPAYAAPPGGSSLPPPYLPGARQFLIQPGQVWQHLVADIRPGDEVVLAAGFHSGQLITGLRGTAERPVIIRSRDPVPAALAASGPGFVLRDPQFVIIEHVLFLNPERAALTIEGSRPDWPAGVLVRGCSVQGSRAAQGQDAIRMASVTDVTLDTIRIEEWADCAVEADSASRVIVSALTTVGNGPHSRGTAVRVRGRSTDIRIERCAFNDVSGAAVEIGMEPDSPEATEGTPSNVVIERCIFTAPGSALRVHAASGVLLAHATVSEPRRAIYELPGSGPIAKVRIADCLTSWTPGTLARFCTHGVGVKESAVTLGHNLWWSRELPDAFPAIGRPFGTAQGTQVFTADPDLDPATFQPRNKHVTAFGALAPAPAGVPAPPSAAPPVPQP